jgi:hypothetical protein
MADAAATTDDDQPYQVAALDPAAYAAQREADLARFAARESGNQNITQRSGGPASGYYQIEDSSRGGSGTWEQGAKWAGVDTNKYPRAMDAPYDVQHQVAQALYDQRGGQPWAMSAPGARAQMSDTSTPDASGLLAMPAVGASDDDVARVLHQLNMGSQQPDSGKEQSFISRLGEAFGGGGGGLTGDAREAAGTRSLMNFGMGLLANSGYHPVRTTMGQALAAGLQGAQDSEITSQDMAYSQQQAQRDQVKNALTILGAQQGRQIQAGQLGVAQQQARTGQQRATTEAGQLGVSQAEERRKQTETDIELQRQKQLLAAPPLFPTGPAPVAPVAPSAVPPTTTPPAGGPAPVQGDQLPTGGGTQTGATTPPGAPLSQFAGAGVPTTTQPSGQMPETAGDVAAILGGMKAAGAKDVGDGTQVAQAGNAVPSLPPSPPVIPDGSKPFVFQLPPVPPSVSPTLTTDEQANLAERYRLALLSKDPAAAEAVRKDMQALQTEKQNKFNDWQQKQQDQQQAAWMQANKAYLDTDLEKTKAGYTASQKQRDQDMAEGTAVEKTADTAATSAADANMMLTQIGANLNGKLPSGLLAQFMTDHPDITNFMKSAGFISGDTVDRVQLINGLTAFMSTRLRQAGSGQLRNLEMAKFQNVLPNLALETPDGQKKALAFLMNMNDRIISEADYTHEQFRRPALDQNGKQLMDPQSGRPMLEYNIPNNFYKNMESPAITDANGNRTGGGLGPVLPHFTGSLDPASDPAAYQAYVQSQKPGRPYYGLRAVKDPKTGQTTMQEALDVAPLR